jgi:hypothetical protein
MESLTAAVDQYCERTDAALWSEPLNAVSNVAFILAAVALCARRRRLMPCERDAAVLIALIVVVGVGSALFHTVATVWARWGDVIPIGLALLWFLKVFLRRILRLDTRAVVLGFLAFGAVTGLLALAVPAPLVNGSNSYFGTLAALLAMAVAVRRQADAARVAATWPFYLAAAGVFGVALVCRSVDEAVCAAWPYGTHFLWHTLNGVALYLAGDGLLRGLAARGPASGQACPASPGRAAGRG